MSPYVNSYHRGKQERQNNSVIVHGEDVLLRSRRVYDQSINETLDPVAPV
jgi:hypothetical protein